MQPQIVCSKISVTQISYQVQAWTKVQFNFKSRYNFKVKVKTLVSSYKYMKVQNSFCSKVMKRLIFILNYVELQGQSKTNLKTSTVSTNRSCHKKYQTSV